MSAPETSVPTPTVATHSIPLLNRLTFAESLSRQDVQLLRGDYGVPSVVGTVEVAAVAWVSVLRMTAGSHNLVHQPSPDAPGRFIAMSLQERGSSMLEQGGRSARMLPGRWSLVDSGQPYTLASPGQTQRLILAFPAERIPPTVNLDAVLLGSFSGTAGVARLAFELGRSIVDSLASAHATRAADLADSVYRLISLTLHDGALSRASDGEPNALADRIRSYINDHLRDPDLCLDTLARNLNASKRSLHRAVSALDGSIHNLIWYTRLDRCRADLLDPSKAHQTIGDIAHSWGFKNLTHFSRAFRHRFHISAREIRRYMRGQT